MREKLKTCARKAALLLLVVGLILPGIGYALTAPEVSHAAPTLQSDDDDEEKQDEDATDAGRSARDDRMTTGQVMDINTLADPPKMTIANMDGVMEVRLLTKDLIAKNGVRLGDHVTLYGEKISEVEFDCQELSVDGHLGDDIDESDDD